MCFYAESHRRTPVIEAPIRREIELVQHSDFMTEALRRHISKTDYGLEVAPYFEPVFRRPDYDIAYTDYIGNDEIREKANENPSHKEMDLPLIDFVWKPGKTIVECLPRPDLFDYIIASHVFEHIANPLGWMTQLLAAMKVGGRLALFLPDRRWSPDYIRRETTFSDILGWWIEQPTAPTIGQVLDFMSQVVNLSHDTPTLDWNDPEQIRSLGTFYPVADIISTGIALYNERPYLDVHCTVWTAMSFRSTFDQVIESGLIGCRIVEMVEETSEFLAVFEKIGEPTVTPPETKAGPTNAGVLSHDQYANLNHKLDILRHDLSFLIDNSHQAAGATYRTAQLASEIAAHMALKSADQ